MTGDDDVAQPTESISAARIEALSDGVFAIALTLLTLNVTLTIKQGETFAHAFFGDTATELLAFALSFAVIALFWTVHHRLFNQVARMDNGFVSLNFVFLAIIAVLPFPSDVLGSYGDRAGAVVLYAIAISLASIAAHVMWVYASRRKLLVPGAADDVLDARGRGFVVAGVFLASIPVAIFVGPREAEYFWILIWPAQAIVRRMTERKN